MKKIVLNGSGYFVRRKEGCFIVSETKTRKDLAKYPILEGELGEIQMVSGNLISTGALTSAAFNHIPVIVKTSLGSPIGILYSIDDFSHVMTRCAQYSCYRNIQAYTICEQIALGKLKGMNELLTKYGLKRLDHSVFEGMKKACLFALTEEQLNDYIERDIAPPIEALDGMRQKLMEIEGHASRFYFRQVFGLFPEPIRPETRKGFKAFDGLNNTFSLAYRILYGKVFKALISAKLEPFLGFYHSIQFGKASLTLDIMELYRYLMDDFLIGYCQRLRPKDFTLKKETYAGRSGKRAFLSRRRNKEFLDELERRFQKRVSVPRAEEESVRSLSL